MAGRLSALDLARFESFVDRSQSCHLWRGGNSRGYGSFWLQGRLHRAHRVAYEIAHGPIAASECVLHRCDTPGCVNPEHLFLGDQAENMHDMKAKGRARAPRGPKHWNWRGNYAVEAAS